MKTKLMQFSCTNCFTTDCSHDFKAKADCQFRAVADLDPDYQYFPGDPTKAGSDTLSDYCPHFSPLLRTSGQTGWCIDSANNAYTLQGMFYRGEANKQEDMVMEMQY